MTSFEIVICVLLVFLTVFVMVDVTLLRRKILKQNEKINAKRRLIKLAALAAEHVDSDQLNQAIQKTDEALRKGNGINNFDTEMRPMLDAVITSTQRIVEDEVTDEERHELGLNIARRVKKLQDIVENVLLMARIDSKRIRFSHSKLVVSDLVNALFEEFHDGDGSYYSHKEGAGCKLGIVEGRPSLCISADHMYLTKALCEILKNAFTFSTQGDIFMGWFYHLDTDEVEIFVEDNGHGISEENLPHVFDIFYKEEHSNGLGIGLPVAKELIEEQGGRLILVSRLNVGTRVSVLFPSAK